jgi:hypothetical protein
MPDWVPVEHDPFAAPGAAAAPPPATGGAGWAPVEHDPFAKPEPARSSERGKPANEAGLWQKLFGFDPAAYERLNTDLQNQRAAAAQGTTPNLNAHKPNLLSDDVMEGDDGNAYFKNAEGKLERADINKHILLKDSEDNNRLKIYSRTDETDEGRASSLGRLLGTGMGAGNIEVSKAAPSLAPTIAAAGRIGVDLPRAIASGSPSVHLAGQVLTKAPGGAPMQKAVDEGIKGLGGALGRAGEEAGGIADTKRAGEGVTTGLEQGFKPRTQELVGQLYDRVDSLVNPKATAPLSNTQKAVSEILAKKQAYGNESLGPAVDAVAGALQRKGGLTYAAIKDLRSSIGEMIDNKFLPPTISQKELNGIYGALSEDLENAAEVTGGSRARAAWQVANNAAKSRSDALETLNKVIGPKTRADEGVMDTLHRMAKDGSGADISTLTATRNALSNTPGAWEDVASTVIGRLGKNSHGEFSPALFIRDYGDLSPAGKRMLFHSVGSGGVIPFLDDIAHVSQKYVQAGKLGNPSGSAGHAAGIAAAGAVMAGIAHGSLIEPITALSAVAGSQAVARILGAPATAASLARWTRTYDNLARIPGARALAAFNVASRNLGGTTATYLGQPSLAPALIEQIKGAARQTNERPNQ